MAYGREARGKISEIGGWMLIEPFINISNTNKQPIESHHAKENIPEVINVFMRYHIWTRMLVVAQNTYLPL